LSLHRQETGKAFARVHLTHCGSDPCCICSPWCNPQTGLRVFRQLAWLPVGYEFPRIFKRCATGAFLASLPYLRRASKEAPKRRCRVETVEPYASPAESSTNRSNDVTSAECGLGGQVIGGRALVNTMLCLARNAGCAAAAALATHSARKACTVSTRAARAAGTNDARTADITTTAADPINGIGPGSWSSGT
jgi:hypothetical protein